MGAEDKLNITESTAAVLVCARCKNAVKSNEQHQCKQQENKNEKIKETWSRSNSGTPFRI